MDFTYYAIVEEQEDGWFVDFPSFGGGVFAEGNTAQEAIACASETLRLAIAEYLDEGWRLPNQSTFETGICVFTVEVSDDYIAGSKCVTPKEAAEILGVSAGRISQMLNDGVLEAYVHGGRRLVTIASLNARKAASVKAGRPKAPACPHRSQSSL